MTTITDREQSQKMAFKEKEYTYKAVLAGKYGAGKTTVFLRIQDKLIKPNEHLSACTDKHDFMHKSEKGETVKLTVWDTAGMERNHSLTEGYYRNAHAIVMVIHIDNRESLDECKKVVGRIKKQHLAPHAKYFLIANKWDLYAISDLTESEIASFAKDIKAQETVLISALNDKTDDIKKIFVRICEILVSSKKQPSVKRKNEFEERKHPSNTSRKSCC